jgi:ferric-dicitrate binding protein FerR (iron transport regulator)
MTSSPEDGPGERHEAASRSDERPDAAFHLDERLNAALGPPPATVERVVRRALEGSVPPAAGRRRRLAAAAAGAALLATLLAIVQLRRPPAPQAPPASRGAIEIRSAGGMVTARSPAGRLWIVGAAPRHPVAGSIILVHIGGIR